MSWGFTDTWILKSVDSSGLSSQYWDADFWYVSTKMWQVKPTTDILEYNECAVFVRLLPLIT